MGFSDEVTQAQISMFERGLRQPSLPNLAAYALSPFNGSGPFGYRATGPSNSNSAKLISYSAVLVWAQE